jgi:type III pantothenate kinase
MDLILDIGNTRIKWAGADAGEVYAARKAAHCSSVERAFAAVAGALPASVERIVGASVAGPDFEAEIERLAFARWGLRIEWCTTPREQLGLKCGYVDHGRFGVDRWMALLGARRLTRDPVCVVDAGTTVTFDAVDATGQHLGGLIFPGPRMAARALDLGTRGIGPTELSLDPPEGLLLLGHGTEQAVSHAAMLQLAAAVDRAARVVSRGLGSAPLVLVTGGDGAALATWLETEVQYRADLVLEGLAWAVSQS